MTHSRSSRRGACLRRWSRRSRTFAPGAGRARSTPPRKNRRGACGFRCASSSTSGPSPGRRRAAQRATRAVGRSGAGAKHPTTVGDTAPAPRSSRYRKRWRCAPRTSTPRRSGTEGRGTFVRAAAQAAHDITPDKPREHTHADRNGGRSVGRHRRHGTVHARARAVVAGAGPGRDQGNRQGVSPITCMRRARARTPLAFTALLTACALPVRGRSRPVRPRAGPQAIAEPAATRPAPGGSSPRGGGCTSARSS